MREWAHDFDVPEGSYHDAGAWRVQGGEEGEGEEWGRVWRRQRGQEVELEMLHSSCCAWGPCSSAAC